MRHLRFHLDTHYFIDNLARWSLKTSHPIPRSQGIMYTTWFLKPCFRDRKRFYKGLTYPKLVPRALDKVTRLVSKPRCMSRWVLIRTSFLTYIWTMRFLLRGGACFRARPYKWTERDLYHKFLLRSQNKVLRRFHHTLWQVLSSYAEI